ncbi:MAG: T9SS type A sorting domain-containing protein [Flavobacterium psychrophilum]
MKKIYSLLLLLFTVLAIAQTVPTTSAPTPPVRNESSVVSVFSEAYTNLADTNFAPWWWQSTVVSDETAGGNAVKKLSNFNYIGVEFASPVNASLMTKLHIDVWTADCTAFDLFLINPGFEQKVTVNPTASGWNSYDIDLSAYTAQGIALNNIIQFKFVSTPFGGTTVYYDNVYFYTPAVLPTITGFTVPSKLVGAAPFTLTAPTSNSTGAFTYTSSNPAVATISGTTVTVIGAGTSIITANQAAAGLYSAGNATSILAVTYPAPTTAPAVPPARSADLVISLFSNSYTNVSGTDWFPNWGQSTSVSDIAVAGNTIKRYTNLNYQGVQFTSPINASGMTNLHVDIYTPNCTAFKLFLINAGIDEQSVTLTPTLAGWNSYDINLAQFPAVALNNIGQFKLEGTPFGSSVVYLDNLYFWKESAALVDPTFGPFTVPSKVIGDAPFSITPPTSNSTGGFIYSSSNPAVASVSGSTITIMGAGTTVIKATQKTVDNLFKSKSVTTNFVVTSVSSVPSAAAPTPPARNAADVVSMFSNAYANVAVDTWRTDWSSATLTNTQIAGNDTKLYESLNFVGVEATGANSINATTMQKMHIDIWTPNMTTFRVKLVDFGANNGFGGGDDREHEITLNPTLSGWNSFDISLSDFVGLTTRAHLSQVIFSGIPVGAGIVYVDNVYFWKDATGVVLPTEPMTAAPTPTVPAANVISLFSDAYTNVAGTDWFPNWGQSTAVSDVSIAGNTTKLFANLNYQGVQFANPVSAAGMSFLHMDIWTPNCTAFKVFLINPGPVEQAVVLTPSLSGWNSYDINLSQYTNINLSNIIQFKLEGVPFGGSKVYVDNIYFSNAPYQATNYYIDADHDGYGSTTVVALHTTTAPVGYSTNHLDCNDANPAIYPSVYVSSNPANATACNASSASFTASATLTGVGQTASYAWQYQTPTGTTWINVANSAATITSNIYSGATTSTLSITNVASTLSGYKYRAVVSIVGSTPTCGAQYSASAVLSVPKSLAGTVTGAAAVCFGGTKTLTLTGYSGSIQWQSSTVLAGTYTDIAGATSATYTTPASTATKYYKAVLTSGNCASATTAAATVTVTAASKAGVIKGGNVRVCAGTNSTILTLSGHVGTIKWQSSTDNATFTDIAGAIAATYTATNISSNTYYRAILTSGICSSETTDAVALMTSLPAYAGTAVGSATVCTGTNSTVLKVNDAIGTIQWQSSADEIVFSNVIGTSSSLTVANLTVATYYRALVSLSGCAAIPSNSVMIGVNAKSVAGTISGAGAICNGSAKTLTLAGNTGSIQWMSASTSTGIYSPIAGATTSPYTTANLSATTYYKAMVTSGVCPAATTTVAAAVTVNPTSVAGSIAGGGVSVCSGTNSTVLSLSGNTGTILWKKSTDQVTWTSLGIATATYTAANLTVPTYYKATVTSGLCSAVDTNPVFIDVRAKSVGGTVTSAGAVCLGASRTLTSTGAAGAIQWQSSADNINYSNILGANATTYVASPSVNTYYRVSAVNNQCTAANSLGVLVIVNPAAAVGTVTAGPRTLLSGTTYTTTLTLSSNTGAIQWQRSTTLTGTYTAIAGATGTSYVATHGTITYYYRARATVGTCTADSNVITVTLTSATKNTADEYVRLTVSAYPNPFSGAFNVKTITNSEENVVIKAYDMTGKLVYNKEIAFNAIDNEVIGEQFRAGMYTVVVQQGEELKTIRVIKK